MLEREAFLGMSRKSVIDSEEVLKLAAMGLTVHEIASFVGVCGRTIERRCAKALKSGRAQACGSLRRKQFEKAVKEGNVTMLIWLGKQMLGQKDRVELDNLHARNGLDLSRIRKLLKGKPADEPADESGRD